MWILLNSAFSRFYESGGEVPLECKEKIYMYFKSALVYFREVFSTGV